MPVVPRLFRLFRRADDRAASPVVGFLASVFVFSMVFGVFLAAQRNNPATSTLSEHDLRAVADNALTVILQEPGINRDGRSDWASAPDRLARFGLASAGSPNFLDPRKVSSLRSAALESDLNNGHPDYEEIRAALGLQDYHFHLRSYPVLRSVDDPLWNSYTGLNVAYLAGYGAPSGSGTLGASTTPASDHLLVNAVVTNTGDVDMVFRVHFLLKIPTPGNRDVEDIQYTPLLAPGQSVTLSVPYHRIPDWPLPGYDVSLELRDAYQNELAEATLTGLSFPEGGSTAYNLIVNPGAHKYVAGDSVQFYLDHYNGNGKRLNAGPTVRLQVTGPAGSTVLNTTLALSKSGPSTVSCPGCTTVGTYTATLTPSAGGRAVTDRFTLLTSNPFTALASPIPEALSEQRMLANLSAPFSPTVYDSLTNPTGDVYRDRYDAAILADRLSDYQVLVIGSKVRQSSLTPNEIKEAIARWVKEDGGTLIVLGTDDPNQQWMRPIYETGIHNANGGIAAPDPTHPILHAPERLRYQEYRDHQLAWSVRDDGFFSHVLRQPAVGGGDPLDVLAVSEPGVAGNGTVILTSYTPGDLTTPQDEHEGLKFLHNLFSQAYNLLYVDFGPPIPAKAQVASSTRLAVIPYPGVPGAQVEMKMVLYVFR